MAHKQTGGHYGRKYWFKLSQDMEKLICNKKNHGNILTSMGNNQGKIVLKSLINKVPWTITYVVHFFIITNESINYLVEPWQTMLTREKVHNSPGEFKWIFEFADGSIKTRNNEEFVELVKAGMIQKSTNVRWLRDRKAYKENVKATKKKRQAKALRKKAEKNY